MRFQAAFKQQMAPLSIKELCVDCDISQGDIAKGLQVSRSLVNLVINKAYQPPTSPDIRHRIERYLTSPERGQNVTQWLANKEMQLADIWLPLGRNMHKAHTSKHGQRTRTGIKAAGNGLSTINPDIHVMTREVTMITEDTRRHFKLFRNPFIGDVEKSSDIYKSDEHRYIEAAMLDAAKHGGFLAVIGEVGSGKTVILREVKMQLQRENKVLFVCPDSTETDCINTSMLSDAIIMSLSEETPKNRREHKARQLKKLLLARKGAGYQVCLIIEEAQDLTTRALKQLKRFYEFEQGYEKLLSIIMVGQIELNQLLREDLHSEMREVIRRIQKAEIRGLGDDIHKYVEHKFKRVNVKFDDIITEEAIAALSRRLTVDDGRGKKPVSHAYPLLINNYVAQAMNLACEMGEPMVTEEVINAL